MNVTGQRDNRIRGRGDEAQIQGYAIGEVSEQERHIHFTPNGALAKRNPTKR